MRSIRPRSIGSLCWVYDVPQTAELIEAVRDTPVLVPTLLAVLCGLRRREICPLRRRYVDPVTGQISVVESLEQTKTPIYVSQHWARTIRTTRLAQLRFHDLPHAHATHLLANGVHPKVASERLGHSKVGITLDLYSHILPGMQERCRQNREYRAEISNAAAVRVDGTDGE